MPNTVSDSNVAQSFQSCQAPQHLPLSGLPGTMTHHNVSIHKRRILTYDNTYGVPPSMKRSPLSKILTPGVLLRRFDAVRDCLGRTLGLTTAMREGALRLLRFQAYYSQVYAKADTVCKEPGCSRRTFWRTIHKLEKLGLLERRNQYVLREKAQTSNLYLLTKLCILIARYLAEHGVAFHDKYLAPYFAMLGSTFWPWIMGGAGGLTEQRELGLAGLFGHGTDLIPV